MGIGRLRHLVPVMVALVVALGAGRASAATTTIGFEDQADGTVVGAQYSGLGVQFVPVPATPPVASSLTVETNTIAHGGTKVVRAINGDCTGTVIFTGVLSTPRTQLGIWIHDPYDANDMQSHSVTLQAFTASGADAGHTSADVYGTSGWAELLAVADPGTTIDHFSVSSDSLCRLVIDDVNFDQPAGVEPPSVVWEDVTTAPVSIERGASTVTMATLRRRGGSTGRVNLSVSGLPGGVSAVVTPAQANGVDLRSGVTLTLSGSTTAPPTGPVQATLTATPADSTAGSTPTSTTFPIVVVPPSVTLALAAPAPTDLYQGDDLTISGQMVRHSQSNGRIMLAATGPAGVVVTVSPATIDGSAATAAFGIHVTVPPGTGRDPDGAIRISATSTDPAAAPAGQVAELLLRAPVRIPTFIFGETTPHDLVLRAGGGVRRVDTLIDTQDVPPNALVTAAVNGIPTGVTVDQSPTSWRASDGATLFKVNLNAQPGLTAASSGFRTIDAHVDIPGHPAINARNYFQLTVVPSIRYALAARGIEVTQGVQSLGTSDCSTIPTRNFLHIESSVPYTGVKLVERDLTVARVYVSAFVLTNVTSLPNIGVRLHGYRNGRELADSPINPTAAPASVKPGDVGCVRPADRASTDNVYTFVLPSGWTYGTMMLQAEILPIPPSDTGAVLDACNSHFCQVMERFTLRSIGFNRIRWPGIKPIRVSGRGAFPGDVHTAFDPALRLHPGDPGLWSYQGDVDITDLMASADSILANPLFGSFFTRRDIVEGGAKQRLYAWALAIGDRSITAGVAPAIDGLAGVTVGGKTIADIPVHSPFDPRPVMLGVTSRPLTSLAHELGHVLGRPHAGQNCNLTRPGNDQEGEQWLPDDMGYLQGVGLDLWGIANDPSVFKPSAAAPYRVIARGQKGGPVEYYDFMSYCASTNEDPNFVPGPDSWLSPRGWNAEVDSLTTWTRKTGGATGVAPRVAAVAPSTPVLTVGAIGRPGATLILSVQAEVGTPAPAGTTGPILVGYDTAGAEVTRAGLTDDVGDDSGLHSYTGSVVSRGVVRVAVVDRAGTALADRAQSAHPPKVSVTSPRKGTTVGGTKPVRLAWNAADADGDRLVSTVETSADDGRTWRRIYQGPATASLLPAGYFAASTKARIRVSVNDGFLTASAVSARFRALRAPAAVHIDTPRSGTTLVSDGTLLLSGTAFTLRGQVPSGRLIWSLDGRVIARGANASARNLPPGRRVLTLAVRGDTKARARVSILIKAVTPPFLRVSLPSRVARTARFVTVRLRSGAAVVVRANGKSVRIKAKKRAVLRVPIKPGRGEVVLPLTAHALGADYPFTRAVKRR